MARPKRTRFGDGWKYGPIPKAEERKKLYLELADQIYVAQSDRGPAFPKMDDRSVKRREDYRLKTLRREK